MSPPAPPRARTTVDSPVGPLTLVAAGGVLRGLSLGPEPPGPAAGAPDRGDAAVLDEATAQLEDYFAGGLPRFDLPLALDGTAFQRTVWRALLEVPLGETTTYGELAGRIGRPGAARAVGLANARNPIAIVVPCHRVVGADGGLTGYGGGLERKRYLLELEGRVAGLHSQGSARSR